MIEVEALYKSFDGVQVLKGVSFKVAQGEVTALIGRSGDGKSVLLKHLAGLLNPDRGRVLLDRQDIGSLRGRALQQMRARLGFLFQGGAL
ncbi:MAG: ATP-binding cassette domain-containing protein, partial [Desulfobacteraceae bacterium]